MINISPEKALISALAQSERDVAVLVGAPLSMPSGDSKLGIPGVKGMLELIEEEAESRGLKDDYLDSLNGESDAANYQLGFSFLQSWCNQDAVNGVIQKAVLQAYSNDVSQDRLGEIEANEKGWHIPKGLKALGELVSKSDKFKGPILTTNFDPLVTKSIAMNGRSTLRTILHSDGRFDNTKVANEDSPHVIHLHGYWLDSDTLHTPEQLTAKRPHLQASLKRLLSEKTLLVVGYGGWDDVFIKALKDLMYDDSVQLDILWAFFENDADIISKRYEKLLTDVQAATTRGRFRAYGGVECNRFFANLLAQNIDTNNDEPKPVIDSASNRSAATASSSDPSGGEESVIGGSLNAMADSWSVEDSPSHRNVRAVEQAQFLEAMSRDKVINIVSDWGMASDKFVCSTLNLAHSNFQESLVFKLDIEDVTTRDGLLSSFTDQLGMSLQAFLHTLSDIETPILFLDSVTVCHDSRRQHEWEADLQDVLSAVSDFLPKIRVILNSKKPIESCFNSAIYLRALDEADIANYISDSRLSDKKLVETKNLGIIHRLTEGAPVRLDRLISNLEIFSLQEILGFDDELTNDSDDSSMDVPNSLKKAIREISSSDEDLKQRSFKLLKVLSILPYGETLPAIKRFDHAKPFYMQNFKELHELGLIESVSRNEIDLQGNAESTTNIHVVPPVVREHMLSKIDRDEAFQMILRASELTFGDSWRNGQIKLSSAANAHIKQPLKAGPGNPHLLAKSMLKHAIEKGVSREIEQSFNVCLFYVTKLVDQSRYRDAVTTASEVLYLANETSLDLNLDTLKIKLARSFRMTGKESEALELFLEVNNRILSLSKLEKAEVYIDMALIYQDKNDPENAIKFAEKAKKVCSKSSGRYTMAESIIAKLSEPSATDNLKKLEKQARRDKKYVQANNIALTLAASAKTQEEKLKLYDQVLDTVGDDYNSFRAISKKINLLANSSDDFKISLRDSITLRRSYEYFYMQRMTAGFQAAHDALWQVFSIDGNVSGLADVFRYSSLIWRLEKSTQTERKYALDLEIKLGDAQAFSCAMPENVRYSLARINLIAQDLKLEMESL